MMKDDLDTPLDGLLRPLIPPDDYDAVVETVKRVTRYGRMLVEFVFRIVTLGPAFDVRLKGYCALGLDARLQPGSKLASWMRLIAHYTKGSPSKVTLRQFKHFWFRVRVATATHNHLQQLLPEHEQHSKVVDLVGVVGMRGELSHQITEEEGRVEQNARPSF